MSEGIDAGNNQDNEDAGLNNSQETIEAQTQNIKSVNDKLGILGANLKDIEKVKRRYPMKITPYYLGLIKEKDDPIWKQSVADLEEIYDIKNKEDPLHEEDCTKVPYLVHKYPDRVLLLISSKCAMYCRFCTRKRKVGRIQQTPLEDIFKAIDYIKEHNEVRDVIVSGGDPLMRSDSELDMILSRLRAIPHLEMIRIGTRMPCVQPSRITKRLVNILKRYHPLFMNIHFNHPIEVTPESAAACNLLADAGIPLGSQTVLLKGVNDNPAIMKELMQKLLKIRVKPYYIYQCDQVRGVEHFRTDFKKGIDVIKKIQGYTSGLAVPHLVIDGPSGKIPISPDYIQNLTDNEISIINYLDEKYAYKNPGNVQNKIRVGLVYNVKKESDDPNLIDKYAEFDDMTTIESIKRSIESSGYEVKLIEADGHFLKNIQNSGVNFVFNIAEGIYGESRESQVPAILDMLKIPYTGSGVLTQAITLNKTRAKEILGFHGVSTPRYQLFNNIDDEIDDALRFPLIVKPNSEGSSKGIRNDSLVNNRDELKKQVGFVIKNYGDALAEEYLDGREFTVSIIGNKNPKVLPIVEIKYDYLPDNVNKFDSYEVKWIYDNPDNPIDPIVCPADLDNDLKSKIEKTALKAYKLLGIYDLARMDVRLDRDGNPHIIDINALPGLIPDPKENSRFPKSCYTAGMSYEEMINMILTEAMKRHGLKG